MNEMSKQAPAARARALSLKGKGPVMTEHSDELVPVQRIVARKIDTEEAHHLRSDIVRCLLQQTVVSLKSKLGPAQWLNGGWTELEGFVEALCTGGTHPALVDWQMQKAAGGRPAIRRGNSMRAGWWC
jgi:hypothetical protein